MSCFLLLIPLLTIAVTLGMLAGWAVPRWYRAHQTRAYRAEIERVQALYD